MASQPQVYEEPIWPDALHAGLVRRLARPLTQPGLLQVRHIQHTLSRAGQMLHGLPLAEVLYQRWGTAVANREGQLPIVYVQAGHWQEDGQVAAASAAGGPPPATPVVQPLPTSVAPPPRAPSLHLTPDDATPQAQTAMQAADIEPPMTSSPDNS